MPTPSTTDPRHAAARRHLQDGAYQAAIPILEALLEDNPDDPDLLNDAALAHAQDGNTAQAERCLRRALEVQPEHETAFYNLLDLLIEARKDVDAREVFASHADQLPDSEEKKECRKQVNQSLHPDTGHGKRVNVRNKRTDTASEVRSNIKDQFLQPVLSPGNADRYYSRKAIVDSVSELVPELHGTVLDIGCGRMPYKSLILSNPDVEQYIGLDLGDNEYANQQEPDLTWDGRTIPLQDECIDCALSTETLEHVPDPYPFLHETWRVLEPGGLFFFTVPFLWPLHDVPHDEHRYTPFAIKRIMSEVGFCEVNTQALGGWHASFAQMIGLWLNRAPMPTEARQHYFKQLYPLYKKLIEADQPPDTYCESTMITGLAGFAWKEL